MTASRTTFLEWIQRQKGKPYVWRAKGELISVAGAARVECFDCSGLVTRGMVEAGYPHICPKCEQDPERKESADLCGFHGAQRLFDELEPVEVENLRGGDLMFFGAGPKHVTHVMVWLNGAQCFGASGGNSDSLDPAISLRKGQQVKVQSTKYRVDLVAYRALPIP